VGLRWKQRQTLQGICTGVKLAACTGGPMSIKLVFQDVDGTTLYNKDILYEGLAPLPVQNEVVHLPGGEKITVVGRQITYVESQRGETDVQVIFVCEREKKKQLTSGVTRKGR
jgi:hypothetical protein